MNEELQRRLAKRREWEGGVDPPENANSIKTNNVPAAPLNSNINLQQPPMPAPVRVPPPIPPQRNMQIPAPPIRNPVIQTVPIVASSEISEPSSPSNPTRIGETRTVPNRPPPPGRRSYKNPAPGSPLSPLSTDYPLPSTLSSPIQNDTNVGLNITTSPIQQLSESYPVASITTPTTPTNAQRGPDDFRKPRPNSDQFKKPPVDVVETQPQKQHRQPPPIPKNASHRTPITRSPSGGSSSSVNASRPPAPGMDKLKGRVNNTSPPIPQTQQSNGSSRSVVLPNNARPITNEQRHEMALKGKNIFNSTISAQEASAAEAEKSLQRTRADSRGSAGSRSSRKSGGKERSNSGLAGNSQYYLVLEDFDPSRSPVYKNRKDLLVLRQYTIIEIVDRQGSEWWKGRIWDPFKGKAVGEPGLFPVDYVKSITDPYDPWEEGDPEGEARAAAEAKEREEREMKQREHKKWLNRNRLFLSLLEMVTNEYKYVCSMWTCVEVFVNDINAKYGSDYVGSLFPSWQTIAHTHEGILKNLVESSRPYWKNLQNLNRNSNANPKRKRESITANLSSLVSLELKSIGQELDSIQEWHDLCILENEGTLNDNLFNTFTDILRDWAESLSNKLLTLAPQLSVSTDYIRNYNDAVRLLERWMKDVPGFGTFIEKLGTNELNKGLHLSAYLIKPVQHICRYPLLIREVHKNCPDETSQAVVGNCQLKLIEVTTEVNSAQGSGSGGPESLGDKVTIGELKAGLRFKNSDPTLQKNLMEALERPTTQVMRVGELGIMDVPYAKSNDLKTANSGTTYQCFLLNVCLIIADKYQNIIGKSRFNVHSVIMTKELGVVGAIDIENKQQFLFAVSVISPDEPNPFSGQPSEKKLKWVFSSPNSADRDSWIRNLEQALSISRGIQGNKNISQSPGLIYNPTERIETSLSSSSIEGKIVNMKDKNAMLQEAHPSQLMEMAKDDPVLNELQRKLQMKRMQQQQQGFQ